MTKQNELDLQPLTKGGQGGITVALLTQHSRINCLISECSFTLK